jgi:hypothetical protein
MAQKFTVPVTIKNLSSAGSDGLTVFLDQESFARLKVEAGGRITWGPGSGAGDTNLYRDAESVLKTDDTFKAAGLYVAGTQIDPTGATVGDALVFNGTKFVSASVAGGGGGDATLTVSDTPPAGASEGELWFNSTDLEIYIYYSNAWVQLTDSQSGVQELYELVDVLIDNPVNGETLVYNGTEWENGFVPRLQTARTISLTGDVSGSTSFDGSSNVNIFTTVNTASVAINELYGVSITNPEEFQTLEYDGTNWVNAFSPTASYVRNAEATTLTTGTVVYLFGGTGDHATVKRADNSSDTTSSKTVGLVAAPIAASENGSVVTRGYVDGIDLSGYTEGDVLWLGTNGQFTTTKAVAPQHLVFIGVVVRATINGIIYVATQNGYELNELHDVKTNGKADKDVLMWNSASMVWINDQINLGTDTVGNYMSGISAGTGIAVSHTPGEGSTATVSIESTAWTAYTPTITADGGGFALNNGTLTGRYKQVGKTVFFSLKFVFGSTTNPGTGHWNFSLPVTAYDSNFAFSAAILDSGVSWYGGLGNGNYTGSTSSFAVIIPSTSSSVTTWASVGNGGPFIWGSEDNITITGSYEAA